MAIQVGELKLWLLITDELKFVHANRDIKPSRLGAPHLICITCPFSYSYFLVRAHYIRFLRRQQDDNRHLTCSVCRGMCQKVDNVSWDVPITR
jgi:hypothetical protein